MAEETIWSGTPSQVLNLGTFILMGLLAIPLLGLPLLVILWQWLVIKNTRYELTTERLITRISVLSRKTDELELYRVKDYAMEQPLFLRMFGLANIVLDTADRSHPRIVLRAVPDGERLRNQIRNQVEQCRSRKKIW